MKERKKKGGGGGRKGRVRGTERGEETKRETRGEKIMEHGGAWLSDRHGGDKYGV